MQAAIEAAGSRCTKSVTCFRRRTIFSPLFSAGFAFPFRCRSGVLARGGSVLAVGCKCRSGTLWIVRHILTSLCPPETRGLARRVAGHREVKKEKSEPQFLWVDICREPPLRLDGRTARLREVIRHVPIG
jgi:hypothetical protein